MDRIMNQGGSADYFGIHKIASIILLIIPITAWVLGIATRCKEGKFVAAILRFIFGGWILWISDIINTAMNGCNVKICRCVQC